MTNQQRAAKRLVDGTPAAGEGQQKVTNLWADAWRRLLRNRAAVVGGVVIILLILTAIFAEQVAPFPYAQGDSADNYMVPYWLTQVLPGNMASFAALGDKFPLGADYLGRDLLSRVIYGTRVSLTVGFIGALTSLLIGLIYGCISGYYGGRVDNFMMRFVDIMYAFPTMLLIIWLMFVFKGVFGNDATGGVKLLFSQVNQVVDGLLGLRGGGMLFIFIGLGITAWMGIARLARGQILSLKEKEFVEASRMIGARDVRIITRHILPNIVGPIIVSVTLGIPGFILTEVFLSFIGLGVDPPTPSWGSMISEGAQSIRSHPNEVLLPALVLAITMFAFNFLGDGLRDALDPRMKGTS
jgi:oligopeptide transport system permease protein